jgi:hypothetical protein
MSYSLNSLGDRSHGVLFDDFLKDAVASNQWEDFVSGTGAAATSVATGVNPTDRALGVEQLSTGTTTGGICSLLCSTQSTLFGYASFSLEWRIQVPTLSTSSQEFDVYAGFSDNAGVTGAGTDGAYFWYNRNVSVNWQFSCINNGTPTTAPSAVAVTAGQWYKLRIDVAANGSIVNFYIDDVNVGSTILNIPTGVGRVFGPAIKIEKSAGTNARLLLLDYMLLNYEITTQR